MLSDTGNIVAPTSPQAVLGEVRRVLEGRRSAEETIRLIRRVLAPPIETRPALRDDAGWPVLRPALPHEGRESMSGRRPGELTWRDLEEGDRVHHFDYGTGAVNSSGPLWIYIAWDDPEEHLNHHTAAIARYLTRLEARTHAEP